MNPRAFTQAKIAKKNLPVDYVANGSAWMTAKFFQDWIVGFDKEMGRAKRKVLLIMDNFSGHDVGTQQLTSIKITFLPPNTTSHLQPLDSGMPSHHIMI